MRQTAGLTVLTEVSEDADESLFLGRSMTYRSMVDLTDIEQGVSNDKAQLWA
jgi:hypothetical protein